MSSTSDLSSDTFPILMPSVQIGFYKRLMDAQSEYLLPALLSLVATLDLAQLDSDLHAFAGNARLASIASFGLRGELVFPTPCVLKAKPSLLSYYRLLLGFSQKEFHKAPFSAFSSMESQGILSVKAAFSLESLCSSLCESAWQLVSEMPLISQDILHSLTLLTLGSQLRGSYNTLLGQKASKRVFEVIRDLVRPAILTEDATSIVIRNAAGRSVRIEFAPDPDIAIREQLASGKFNNRIAIEIKGGTDISNIHNRLGEAEKSHQKAKNQGFNQFWTMVNVERLNHELARRESPTTTAFFSIDHITDSGSSEHGEFRELLQAELGLKAG
jgi:XcyI restriction endonuclease